MQAHATSEKNKSIPANNTRTPKQQPFFLPVVVQPKLTIGPVDDPYEREADAVADKVMRMPAAQNGSFFFPSKPSILPVQRKCAACEAGDSHQEEEDPIADGGMATSDHSIVSGAPLHIQRFSGPFNGQEAAAPASVDQALANPGRPLEPTVQRDMEQRFGHDFSQVRVHTDAAAQQSAQDIHAKAYTAGKDIVFANGQYAPHSAAGQRLLAHELVHTIQQRNGGLSSPTSSSIQRAPDDDPPILMTVNEPAGGCGLCYGGPQKAGTAVHRVVQQLMVADDEIVDELALGKGFVDLAVVRKDTKQLALGEIKPANERGMEAGIEQIEERLRVSKRVTKNQYYAGYKRVKLDYPVQQPIHFHTDAPFCPEQPAYCFSQNLIVVHPQAGLYLYFCEPSYSELKSTGCDCDCEKLKKKREKKKEKEKESDPSQIPSIPELLTLGAKVYALLLADGLLGAALSFVGSLAVALTPLLALAALAVGIVFLWDKLKAVAHLIAGVAKFVWDKVSAVAGLVWGALKVVGKTIAKLAVLVGGLIKDLAEAIAEGLLAVGRGLVKGVKWVGGKIASGAKAVWDWLFGSDPEAEAPTIDLPIHEEPAKHCGMVAYDDTIIKLDADTLFPFNEWKLKPEANSRDYPPLKKAAATVRSMLRKSNDRIIVNGYADYVGGVDYNQHLSEQRAETVRDWLVQYGGIPRSNIISQGFGKSRAQGKDTAGRANDRRVEIWGPKHGSVEKVCW